MAEESLEEIISKLKAQPTELWEKLFPIYDITKPGIPITLTFRTFIDGEEALVQRQCQTTEQGILWAYKIKYHKNELKESYFPKKEEGVIEKLFYEINNKFSKHYQLQKEREWQQYEEQLKLKEKQEAMQKQAEKISQEQQEHKKESKYYVLKEYTHSKFLQFMEWSRKFIAGA